jgi:hypothetical protein
MWGMEAVAMGRKRAAEVTGTGLTLTAKMNAKGIVVVPAIWREEAGLKAPCQVRLLASRGKITISGGESEEGG